MPGPEPPPEARLIARKREQMVPRVSQREAAVRAGISATRWRQLETGVIRVRGQDHPETAPAETLARMAFAVGVTPAELAECRPGDSRVAEAAGILGQLRSGGGSARQVMIDGVLRSPGLTEHQKRYIADLIRRSGEVRDT